MEPSQKRISDPDVRHYFYTTFAETSRPPTTLECAEHFDISVADVDLMPMQMCWKLAQKRYAGRLDHDWQRPGQAQIQQLFNKLGLKGAFWNLGGKT